MILRWKNTKAVIGDFSRFANDIQQMNGERMRWLNRAIVKDFFKMEKDIFLSEGLKGDHGKWARLSPDYKARKDKHFPGKTIMRRTDKLFKSLTKRTADSILFIGKLGKIIKIRLGSQLDYGEYWQEGVLTKRGNIKRRTIDSNEWFLRKFVKDVHYAIKMRAKDLKNFDAKNIPMKYTPGGIQHGAQGKLL